MDAARARRVLALASGCGGGECSPPLPGPAQQILTRTDVNKYGKDTPEYTLLNWRRDAQYANLRGYLSAFPKPLRKLIEQDPKAARALSLFSGSVSVARPGIVTLRKGTGRPRSTWRSSTARRSAPSDS